MWNLDSSHSGKNRTAFVPAFNSVSLRVTWRVTTRGGLRTEIIHSDRANLPSQEILAQEDAVESNFLLFQELTTNPFVQMIRLFNSPHQSKYPLFRTTDNSARLIKPKASPLRPLVLLYVTDLLYSYHPPPWKTHLKAGPPQPPQHHPVLLPFLSPLQDRTWTLFLLSLVKASKNSSSA